MIQKNLNIMLANPRISFWEKSLLQDFLKNIHFLYLYAAIAYFLKILLRISINKTFSCVSRGLISSDSQMGKEC